MKMNHGENNTTMKPVKERLNGRTTQIKHMKTIHGENQCTCEVCEVGFDKEKLYSKETFKPDFTQGNRIQQNFILYIHAN